MNPSTTTSSSLAAIVAPPPSSSPPPTFTTLPGEIRNRIFAYVYENPRRSASCAVNRQIYDEARSVLLRMHPFVKATGIVGEEYNDWMTGASSSRLPTVQFGTQGKVTNFRHYQMNIRVKRRGRDQDMLPRVHIMLVGDEEIRAFCRRSTAGIAPCRNYMYRLWFHPILPIYRLLRIMEARILSYLVDEWFEFRHVGICNVTDHDLATEVMLSVRAWQTTTADAWLREVARACEQLFPMIVYNDVLGARIAYDELWIILTGTHTTQMWQRWVQGDQSVADRTRTEIRHAQTLLLTINNM